MDFDELVDTETEKFLKDMTDILTGKKKDSVRSMLFQIMANVAAWRRNEDKKIVPKYPKSVVPNIVQYDENVYVWLDETGKVGGVSPSFEETLHELNAYAESMRTKKEYFSDEFSRNLNESQGF